MLKYFNLRDLYSDNNKNKVLFLHSNSKKNLEESRYLERALMMASNEDVVLLKDIDNSYLDYLNSINFSFGNIKKINVSNSEGLLEKILLDKIDLSDFQGFVPSFFADFTLQDSISSKLNLNFNFRNNIENIKKFSDKFYFKNLCEELDIPIIIGKKFRYSGNISNDKNSFKRLLEKELEKNDSLIVRASRGSGKNYMVDKYNVESFLLNFFKDKERIDSELESDIGYLIDKKINLTSSPNITFYINKNGELFPISISNQLIKNLKHIGNSFNFMETNSIKNQVEKYGLRIAEKIVTSGYTGVFGIDFIEDDIGNLYGCEINLRVNGNNYVVSALKKLEKIIEKPIPLAYSKVIKTSKRYSKFEEFQNDFNEIIFDGKKDSALFPYNSYRLCRNKNINGIFFSQTKKGLNEILSKYYKINSNIT